MRLWGGQFCRQSPSGRLCFSRRKSLLEAGCRLIARPTFITPLDARLG